jgi:peroxiredoxin
MIKNDRKIKSDYLKIYNSVKAGYYIKYLALIFLFVAICNLSFAYNFSIKIENCGEKLVYLCKHRGPDFIIIDSIKTNAEGLVVFTDDKKLEYGVYFIVIPPHSRFDFLIADNQNISINTDMNNIIGSLRISGEKQYQYFADLIKEVAELNKKKANLNMQRQFFAANMPDTVKFVNEKIDSLDKHQHNLYDKYKNMLDREDYLYKILNLLSAVIIPEEIENSRLEKSKEYYDYTRRHFLDRIDFEEEHIINTPEFMFHKLIETYAYYFIELRSTDIKEAKENADFLINKAKLSPAIHQYVLSYLLAKYQNHNDKRLERLMLHLFDEHIFNKKPDWMDEHTYSVVEFFISSLRYNLIGDIAKEIKLYDFAGNLLSMYEMQQDYKIVWFWEPECEVCEEQTLVLMQEYQDLKLAGAEIFAVCISDNNKSCVDFIEKHDIPWINVIDNNVDSELRQNYGIIKTPRVYLLNSQHEILAKDIRPSALYSIIISNR